MNKKPLIFLVLFLTAFLLRVLFLLYGMGVETPLTGDMNAYHGYASSFVQGNGWQYNGNFSDRPPLTPALLVPLYYLFGPDPAVARWLMVTISSLTVPTLFILLNTLFPNRRNVAVFTSVFWIIYPPSIFIGSLIWTENLAVLLIILSLYYFLLTIRSGNHWHAVWTGVFWGLCALNRSSFLYLPLILLIVYVIVLTFRYQKRKLSWIHWTIAFMAMLLTITPWTIRNYKIHKVFMPIESRLGSGLLICNGTLDNERIQSGNWYWDTENWRLVKQGKSEVERDRIALRLAIKEIKKNWHLLPNAIFHRAVNFWTFRPDPYKLEFSRTDWIMLFIWIPILLTFILSFFFWSWQNDWPVLMMIAYVFLITLVFWGIPRFRFPVEPLIVFRSMVGLTFLFHWFRLKRDYSLRTN